ncbi:MAG: hypothetical protein ABSH41_19585 [Syntrophobacteraceae bacterium]
MRSEQNSSIFQSVFLQIQAEYREHRGGLQKFPFVHSPAISGWKPRHRSRLSGFFLFTAHCSLLTAHCSIDLTPVEIRREGWEALVSKLGVAKSLRFLLEYENGHGNYTELRKELFATQTVDDILDGMAKEGEHHAEEI